MPVRHPQRVALAQLPTPLVRLRRLEREVGGQIWMKRDDLTGLELSGNKVRKLEYVAAEAQAAGFDTLITEGTPQSNHCRATAAVCARLGMRAHLLLRPAPTGPPQGNLLLDELLGASVQTYSREVMEAERDRIVADAIHRAAAAGFRARFTPMGASEPLGCWGYIRAAAELAEQLLQAGIEQCDVVVALSSGGTYAGLLLGKLLHRLDHVRVHAVPVSDDAAHHRAAVGALCRATIAAFSLPVDFRDSEISLIDGYVGDGYAIPYEAALAALRRVARLEGVVLDPVYTSKAFCAVVDLVRAGRMGHERPVVFIHTGGMFSNFAWPDLLVRKS